MQPGVYDLTIYKGDKFKLFFRVREGGTETTPGPYQNLSGWTPKAQIRATAASEEVLAEFTATLSDQVTSPGGILLTLSKTQTAGLVQADPKVKPVWDVQITNDADSEDVKTYLKGKVKLIEQVTR